MAPVEPFGTMLAPGSVSRCETNALVRTGDSALSPHPRPSRRQAQSHRGCQDDPRCGVLGNDPLTLGDG